MEFGNIHVLLDVISKYVDSEIKSITAPTWMSKGVRAVIRPFKCLEQNYILKC